MGNTSSQEDADISSANIEKHQNEENECEKLTPATEINIGCVRNCRSTENTDDQKKWVESKHDGKKDIQLSDEETKELAKENIEKSSSEKQQQDNTQQQSRNRKISSAIKQTILESNTVRTIRRKTSKIMNVTPQNLDIVNYCKSLINVSFHGQTIFRSQLDVFHLINDVTSHCLPTFLQSMDTFLRSFGTKSSITGEEEEFKYYIQGVLEHRNSRDFMEKFWKDAQRFLKIYNKRGGVSDQLNHSDYWGTRQQLLAGKIIADYIDEEYGPMDPIFGVLLCPVAGRAGPGDSGIVHEILFDDDGPLAYHSAVHDAFGYLFTFHNVGPGYNYVGADCEILNASRCLSGQISGLHLWRELLKDKSEKAFSVV